MSDYQTHPAENGYEFRFGDYLSEGFELYKRNIGLFVGSSLIYGLIVGLSAYTFVGFILLAGPLTGGLYRMIQNVDEGKPATIGDLFSDFGNLSNHIVGLLLVILLVFLGMLCLILPGYYLAVALSMVFPCITLLGQDWRNALRISRKVIHKNWWWWFLFFIVNGFIAGSGIIAFGIGVIFTAPLQYIFNYVAFKHIFMVNSAATSPDDPEILDSGFLNAENA